MSRKLASPYYWTGLLSVIALFALAIFIRLPDYKEGVGQRNLEASYHVLLTLNAFDQTPAAQHHFLPTISLGSPQDKNIPWGSTLPTPHGDYVYTSFFSGGFVVPYVALKAVGADLTLHNLALFNGVLGLVATALLFTLAMQTARTLAMSPKQAAFPAVLACLPNIFSAQSLECTGLIYWHQMSYQLILIGFAYAMLQVMRRSLLGEDARGWKALLLVLAFVGPMFDWTAMVVDGGTAVYLFWRHRQRRDLRMLSLALAGALVAALLVIFIHYASMVGVEPFLKNQARRFRARNMAAKADANDFDPLHIGYMRSYGTFLLIFAAAALAGLPKLISAKAEPHAAALRMVLIVAAFAMFENIALMEHAAQFAFDRLKFTVIYALMFVAGWQALARSARPRLAHGLMAAASLLACVLGWQTYRHQLATYSGWQQIHADNLALRDKLDTLINRRCAVFASDTPVRGYTNLLFMRGVRENVLPAEFDALAATKPACGAVYLHGHSFRPDIFAYSGATVVLPEGKRLPVAVGGQSGQ